jgi:hypothetical protein
MPVGFDRPHEIFPERIDVATNNRPIDHILDCEVAAALGKDDSAVACN